MGLTALYTAQVWSHLFHGPLMKQFGLFCALLLAVATTAHAQEGIGFSEITVAPEATDWETRTARLTHAHLIELSARVIVAGKPERRVDLVRTQTGTVGCLVEGRKACASLRGIGLADLPVDRLLDFLMALTAEGQHARTLPGASVCWALPEQEKTTPIQASLKETGMSTTPRRGEGFILERPGNMASSTP